LSILILTPLRGTFSSRSRFWCSAKLNDRFQFIGQCIHDIVGADAYIRPAVQCCVSRSFRRICNICVRADVGIGPYVPV